MGKGFNKAPAGQHNRAVTPEQGGRVVFIAGNSMAASSAITEFTSQLGFAPVEVGRTDQGGVSSAGSPTR